MSAPKVTLDQINALIIGAQFWQVEGTTLTVCVMKLKNGTMVVGQSACVSPENFDAEIGKNMAYDDAIDKVWALEGYLLRERLSKINDMPVIEDTQIFTDAEALEQVAA